VSPLAILYGCVAAVLVGVYVWYWYLRLLPEPYRWLRSKGWSRVGACVLVIFLLAFLVGVSLVSGLGF